MEGGGEEDVGEGLWLCVGCCGHDWLSLGDWRVWVSLGGCLEKCPKNRTDNREVFFT